MAEKYIKRSDVAEDEGDPAKKFYLCEDSFVLTDHDAHMWFESLKDLFDGTRNDVDAERRRRFSNAYMFKMGGKCYKAHMDKGWGHLPQPAASATGKVLLAYVWKIVGRLSAVISLRAKAQIGSE